MLEAMDCTQTNQLMNLASILPNFQRQVVLSSLPIQVRPEIIQAPVIAFLGKPWACYIPFKLDERFPRTSRGISVSEIPEVLPFLGDHQLKVSFQPSRSETSPILTGNPPKLSTLQT